jgi:hypothetical protein
MTGAHADWSGAAHIIRNKTLTSSAICSLDAIARWAVTGTPIQNSLADLSGLLRFLRFRPYDDPRVLDNDVFSYLRDPKSRVGEGAQKLQEGTRRWQALCRPIMIQRSKRVISLPRRRNLIRTVDFTPEEEWEYRRIESYVSNSRETPTGSELGASTIWNKLQLISRLRMFCNLGRASCLTSLTRAELSLRSTQGSEDPQEAIISSQIALGGTCCVQCQGIIDDSETPSGHSQPPLAYYSTCGLVFCNTCAGVCNYTKRPPTANATAAPDAVACEHSVWNTLG